MTSATETKDAKKELQQEEQLKARAEQAKALIKDLFHAGVHLGHETSNWNPKMQEYIHSEKNGIYIIDLIKTVNALMDSGDFLRRQGKMGRNVLFVGTSKQCSEIIKAEAERAGAFFINQRWLGGLITNFDTIRGRLNTLRDLEQQRDTGGYKGMGKKEIAMLSRQINKLNKSIGGLKKMRGKPDVIFVIDQHKDSIAVQEAKKAGIPLIALADTNCDPSEIKFLIPANDNSMRSVKVITKYLADCLLEGASQRRR